MSSSLRATGEGSVWLTDGAVECMWAAPRVSLAHTDQLPLPRLHSAANEESILTEAYPYAFTRNMTM